MIGWSMCVLAAVIWLPLGLVAAFGLAVTFGHNLVDPYLRALIRPAILSPLAWFWQVLYFGASFKSGYRGRAW